MRNDMANVIDEDVNDATCDAMDDATDNNNVVWAMLLTMLYSDATDNNDMIWSMLHAIILTMLHVMLLTIIIWYGRCNVQ